MYHYIKQPKKLFLTYILLVPLSCFASVSFALSCQPIIDAALKMDETLFLQAASGCVFWGLADILLILIVNRTKFRLLARAKASLKQDLCHSIMSFNYQCFEGKDYLSTLSNDTQTISDYYFSTKLMLYKVIWGFALSFITVSMLSPVITVILLVVGVISVLIPQLLGRTLDREQSKLSKLKETYFANVKDLMDGFLTIKTGCSESFFEMKHKKVNFDLEEQQCKVNFKMYFAGWFSMLCSSVMYITTIIVGGLLVIKGYMSTGFIITISQLIGGVVAPLEQIPAILAQMRSVECICLKCKTILSKKPARHLAHSKDACLICQNVSFHYANSEQGIKNLDYTFQPGKKYLITGSSGGGKSTAAKLLAGLYESSDGKILYPSKLKSLNEVVYVPQNVHIFNDTLRNNLTLGEDFSDSDIVQALERCGLSGFLHEFQQDLNKLIGEARPCSGGETQRIGLARAILHNPKILILDEVTANLDNQNAQRIESILISISETLIISITHRLNEQTIKKYDNILVMEDGRVTESGSFEQLRQDGSAFDELFRAYSDASE